jgi:hypothetical protein
MVMRGAFFGLALQEVQGRASREKADYTVMRNFTSFAAAAEQNGV